MSTARFFHKCAQCGAIKFNKLDPRTWENANLPFTFNGDRYIDDKHPDKPIYPTTRGTMFMRLSTTQDDWVELDRNENMENILAKMRRTI